MVRDHVLTAGFARLDDLAAEFGVSLMTIHRDVDALAEEGWLTKMRGGATANPSALAEASVNARAAAMAEEKRAMADVAAGLLGRGQAVFLDDSTTAMALTGHLLAHAPAMIATNFVPAITALGTAAGIELNLLGGTYEPRLESCYGQQTVEAISALHADVLFMSTTAITDRKCLHRSEATVLVRQALMEHASRRVLLVDHAKFGRPAPHVLCEIDAFDVIITDNRIDAEDLAELRQHCDDVQVASVPSPT